MPFTSSSILVYENTSNTVVDFQSNVSTPVSLNISSAYDGVTLDYVVSRAGYTKPAGQFVGGGAIDISVTPAERKDPDGTPAYTATSSANIAVTFTFSPLRCFIDIGDAAVSSQTIVDEIEVALATQDGCRFLIESGGSTALQAVLAGQTYLLLGAFMRLRRATAGDVNAAIDAYVIGADGVVLDGTNGGVQFLTAQDIGALFEAALTSYGVAKEATVSALAAANQIEHDATQAAIAALPAPLDSTQTQAAAAAALVAYDAVVPADLAGLATSANVTAAQAAVIAEVQLIPTNPLLTTDSRLNNLDVAISTRATLSGIEGSAVLAKEATVSSKASQASVDAVQASISALPAPLNSAQTQAAAAAALVAYDGVVPSDLSALALEATAQSIKAKTDVLVNGPTLAAIEASTVLAKEATLATKASQASIDALPDPLNSVQTQAAAAAALAAYGGVVATDLDGLATSAEVAASEAAVLAAVNAIDPIDATDVRTELEPELTLIRNNLPLIPAAL